MQIIFTIITISCIVLLVLIAWLTDEDIKDLKAQRNELERENLELTARINQLKIYMEV